MEWLHVSTTEIVHYGQTQKTEQHAMRGQTEQTRNQKMKAVNRVNMAYNRDERQRGTKRHKETQRDTETHEDRKRDRTLTTLYCHALGEARVQALRNKHDALLIG